MGHGKQHGSQHGLDDLMCELRAIDRKLNWICGGERIKRKAIKSAHGNKRQPHKLSSDHNLNGRLNISSPAHNGSPISRHGGRLVIVVGNAWVVLAARA